VGVTGAPTAGTPQRSSASWNFWTETPFGGVGTSPGLIAGELTPCFFRQETRAASAAGFRLDDWLGAVDDDDVDGDCCADWPVEAEDPPDVDDSDPPQAASPATARHEAATASDVRIVLIS